MRRLLWGILVVASAGLAALFIRDLMRREAEQLEVPPSPPGTNRANHARGSNNKGRTKQELYEEAQRLKISGRSRMNKEQLERALEAARASG